MKTTNLKWIALTLAALLVFQSCRVYHSKTATVEEAVQSATPVKVKNLNDETLKFQKLMIEDGKLYGIVWKRGNVAKKFAIQIVENLGNDEIKILLDENTIKEYHLKNKTMSMLMPFLTLIFLVGSFYGLLALSYAT